MSYVTGVAGDTLFAPSALEAYAWQARIDRPTLFIDRAGVVEQYRALARGLAGADIHYAVKANPAQGVLSALAAEGCRFDAASRAEIADCLALGVAPGDISFGNTVKRPSDIAWAHASGITLFAADAVDELDKIAAHAPGARICLRLLAASAEADWPLTRKFGCPPERAVALLDRAAALGLRPEGLSFHVGSQTRAPAMWDPVIETVAGVWQAAAAAGHALVLLNIGGGFPASYGASLMPIEAYAADVLRRIRARIPAARIMAEPGRGLVAEAGVIAAEVLLVDRKAPTDTHRWVFLDIGKFSGLAETMDEAIRYPLVTLREHEAKGPCVLAGPSCDSADVLYERRPVLLPLGLTAGERVLIRHTGAYTASYASVGFNGFPPLAVEIV